jgi:hypothetical protein
MKLLNQPTHVQNTITPNGQMVIDRLRSQGLLVIVDGPIIKSGGTLLSPSRTSTVEKFMSRHHSIVQELKRA